MGIKISALPPTTSVNDGDELAVVQGGTTKKITRVNFLAGFAAEEAQDAVGNMLSDAGDIDFTYDDATPSITAHIKAATVTEAKQVLADNTTNDVTSTKHGYAPKSPGNAATFLNGAATPAFAAVTDADLSTTDVTTNNATTSKHGFVIKATAPSSGIRNVVAIDNGETVYKNTALVDDTNPAALGTAAPGTSLIAARRDHVHANLVDGIQFIIDGGGATITTGIKGDLEIPFACTINQATLLADQSGSIVIDIWKDTYANYPPTDADSITAAAPPTISSATKSQDATLTGWTTAIAAGSTLRFNVDSITTCTRVTLSLKVTRT